MKTPDENDINNAALRLGNICGLLVTISEEACLELLKGEDYNYGRETLLLMATKRLLFDPKQKAEEIDLNRLLRSVSISDAVEIAKIEYEYWKKASDDDPGGYGIEGMGAAANILGALAMGKTPEQFKQGVSERDKEAK